MAKERFIGQRGASKPDPGLEAMKQRVAQQQAARKAVKAEKSAPDPGLAKMQARVQAQKDARQSVATDAPAAPKASKKRSRK